MIGRTEFFFLDHHHLVWSNEFQAWLFSATTCYESGTTIMEDRFQAWLFLATTLNKRWSERNTHAGCWIFAPSESLSGSQNNSVSGMALFGHHALPVWSDDQRTY